LQDRVAGGFPGKLRPAVLIGRRGRFTLAARRSCGAADEDEQLLLHLPNSGRLETMLVPGSTVWYLPARTAGGADQGRSARSRVTAGRAVLVDVPGVGLGAVDANALAICVAGGLAAGGEGHPFGDCLPTYQAVRQEVRVGARRFDIALLDASGQPAAYLEVKSVTLARGEMGLFPDAPTVRGASQVRLLGEMAAHGIKTGVIFAAGRPDIRRIAPHREVDPKFAQELSEAASRGLTVLACLVRATPEGLILERQLPVSWE